jgi:hypothetical protein
LIGKSERKRSLGRPRRRWENNISKGFREIDFGGVDLIHLAHGRIIFRKVSKK